MLLKFKFVQIANERQSDASERKQDSDRKSRLHGDHAWRRLLRRAGCRPSGEPRSMEWNSEAANKLKLAHAQPLSGNATSGAAPPRKEDEQRANGVGEDATGPATFATSAGS